MKTKLLSAFLLLGLFYLAACKKDSATPNPNSSNIKGNYTFVGLTASTVSSQTIFDGTTTDKTVTYAEYATKNNTGTLLIDDTTITSAALSYSIDTTVKVYSYENGALIDSFETDFTYDVPESGGTSGYSWVNSDSINITSGSMFFQGTTSPTGPAGARVKMEGNKLFITASKTQTSQDNQGGYIISSELKGSVVATYQKQ